MTLVSPGDDVDAAPINFMADRTIDRPIGRILSAAATSIPNNTVTAVPFAAEDYDTHSFHDIVTNNTRVTPTAAWPGYYAFTAGIIHGSRADYTLVDCFWRKNGSILVPPGNRRQLAATAAGFQGVTAVCQVFLDPAAGDYMEVLALQLNGAAAAQALAFSSPLVATAEWRFMRR